MSSRSSALARRASSGVAARSVCRRSSSRCSARMVVSASCGSDLPIRTPSMPSDANSGPRCTRSSSISRASRSDGGSAESRSSTLAPSARAMACSCENLGSRLPFSSVLTCDGARSIAVASSSSVMPRLVRRWRIRRPIVSASGSASGTGAGPVRPLCVGREEVVFRTVLPPLSIRAMTEGDIRNRFRSTEEPRFFCQKSLVKGLRGGRRSYYVTGRRGDHVPSRGGEPLMSAPTIDPTSEATTSATTAVPAATSVRAGDQVQTADELRGTWESDPRWAGIDRTYTAEDVVALRGSVGEEYTLARRGAERLWRQLHEEDYINALGALTGNQAVQQVKAGLQAIYLSGWQVAGDANLAGQTYPDQSLYPANSVPAVVRRINNALLRADQIDVAENGTPTRDWLAPIVADAEAGFGGPLNAYELMKSMIQSGAAGVHWEDQLASEKKCGHLG